jgi:hypothetical protein
MPLFSLFFPCLNVIFKSLESASALGCLQLWSFFNCSDWCGFFLSFIFSISSAIFPLRLILKTMFLWFSWLLIFFSTHGLFGLFQGGLNGLLLPLHSREHSISSSFLFGSWRSKLPGYFMPFVFLFNCSFQCFFFFLNHSVFICVLHMVCRAVFYSFQPWQRAVGTKGRFF